MSNYRRSRTSGGCYFFTIVTNRRQPILTLPEARPILREVIHETREKLPFEIGALILLPDHLHCMWTLPEDDRDFSKRWGMIKAGFSKLDWPYSSFHRLVKAGIYPVNWCGNGQDVEGDFGE